MLRFVSLWLLGMLFMLPATAQEVIRVTGIVTSQDKKTPLFDVNIIDSDSKRVLTHTDADGRFAIDLRSNATLTFSMIGAKKVNVKIKNRNFINVNMEEEDVFLKAADVVAKRIVDKVKPEQTDIELRGNYFHIRTRVRVPREMFSHDTRLVIQPILNNATTGEQTLMRPMVYDAATYHRTQRRMYDFALNTPEGDPLAAYTIIKNDTLREKGRTNDIIGYSDSIYVERIKDEYTCDVYMAIEDYNKICYRDTTVIARGTVNPLRWLDYSFSSAEISDTTLYPKAEKQLRDSKGQIDLRFPLGKATFDPNSPHNQAELEKLRLQIQSIQQTPDATLQALSIEGTSSPDGRYAFNLNLAKRRMDFALNYLKLTIPEHLRQHMKFSSDAQVASWSEVVALLQRDSLTEEANAITHIIERYSNSDTQSQKIRKLPFFKNTLETNYLPQLRTVGYSMNYSIFRQLTFNEIKELYKKDYRQLSRYEFFRLYREESNAQLRETILRQALEMYPSFMVAANDLQAMLIADKRSETDLLTRFAGEKAPATVNINHVIAQLASGKYSAADSIAVYIPQTPENELLIAVNNVLNGRYEGNYTTIAQTGKQNEMLLLLAMKQNQKAYEICQQLPKDQALTHYLMATCLNRLEKPIEAYEELKTAIKMNPELEKTALVDGDVNDLLLDKKR